MGEATIVHQTYGATASYLSCLSNSCRTCRIAACSAAGMRAVYSGLLYRCHARRVATPSSKDKKCYNLLEIIKNDRIYLNLLELINIC